MSEKNNIENLFRNKFKDFEVDPPEQVWCNIETKLSDAKKQKRTIPFWIRVSGAAAIFLLGVTIASNYVYKKEYQNSVVNSLENNSKDFNRNQINPIEKPEIKKALVVENTNSLEKTSSKNEDFNLVDNKKSVVNQNSIVSRKSKSKEKNLISEKADQNTTLIQNSKINEDKITNDAFKSENKNSVSDKVNNKVILVQKTIIEENKITNNEPKSDRNKTVSIQNSKKLIVNKKSITVSNQNSLITNNSKFKNKNLDSKKPKLFNSSSKRNSIALVQNEEKNINSAKISDKENFINSEKTENNSEFNSTINQSIIISKNYNSDSKIVKKEIKKDTAIIVSNLPNPLEELLTKKDRKSSDKVAKVNRWQVFPNVAPIYFGSASNGSPIDDIFSKNSKNYKPNLSYGLAINYSVNKRFSVQTGVNKVTLDYNTNDIIFYADLKATNIKTINSKNEAAKMRVENKQANSDESIATVINQGYLNQKIGYIEIPVEVNYKLIDKKFGINLNGGISTLVLNENTVSVVSDTNFKMVLGEANNLNKFHVSSNIGVGFNYKFMKSFQINVEPKLKYQINTFNGNDGNFKPYFIGIYSGISYHF